MPECIPAGTWVEIHRVVLAPAERAPHLPEDTRRVPLELRVRGFLAGPASLGDEVEIATAAGRRLRGTLVAANPAYTHGFGAPVPALSPIAGEVRALLEARGRER